MADECEESGGEDRRFNWSTTVKGKYYPLCIVLLSVPVASYSYTESVNWYYVIFMSFV